MKLITIIFLLSYILVPLQISCMEDKTKTFLGSSSQFATQTDVPLKKKNLKEALTKVELKLNTNKGSINYTAFNAMTDALDKAKKKLNAKKLLGFDKETLSSIRVTIDQIDININKAVQQKEVELNLVKAAARKKPSQQKLEENITPPALSQRSFLNTPQTFPTTEHVYYQTPQALEFFTGNPLPASDQPNPFASQPTLNDENTDSQEKNDPDLLDNLSEKTLLEASKDGSQTNQALLAQEDDQKPKNSTSTYDTVLLPQFNQPQKPYVPYWKQKMLCYLGSAGICTTLGLYSYYKLSPESWYRPLSIGVSFTSSAIFTFLSYRNLKYSLKKQ